MTLIARIIAFFRNAFTRRKRQQEWAARFDTPPEKTKKLPLNPDNPNLG